MFSQVRASGEKHTLLTDGAVSWKGKDSNQGPHSVSIREPENPGGRNGEGGQVCTGLLTKPHIPNNLWGRPGNPGLWQLNTEFLVERFTGTQCSQGLTGRPASEESYTGLLEKTITPTRRKRTPQPNGANDKRDPLWPMVEREFCSNCGRRAVLQA